MAKSTYKIPFNLKGDMVTYYSESEVKKGSVILKENFEFEEILTYSTYSRGRSSVTIDFLDSKGHSYSMFVSDFDNLLHTKGLDGKKIKGTFSFIKKGSNFGVKLIK